MVGAGSPARPGAVTAADRDELLDSCRAHREELILKPGVGYGGVGAVLGREVSDREWSEILIAVKDQDYVVQRIVTPASEPVCNPDTGALEDWRANWGIFTTRAGYAGAFVRALQVRRRIRHLVLERGHPRYLRLHLSTSYRPPPSIRRGTANETREVHR